eukprot:TRINITY_DN67700_c0_g1_i1.p1 TRINITY_DN67700_c0_g1~~TRINITY_DN67700_c0_g1_i1.p1  ORF type:complete len:274 (+),score=33.74 TRINITY_DN67700_c0_g1_i1:86-823(+)
MLMLFIGMLLGGFLATVRRESAPTGRRLLGLQARDVKPILFWNESVLPPNVVNQTLALAHNPHYGYHVFALGLNGSIFHKFQTGPERNETAGPMVPMSDWHVLTPNASLVFANDPAVAANADGHLELIVAYQTDSLDLWQMYQTDVKDPLAWSVPRGPACACEDPDPSKCPWCQDCESRPECSAKYWCTGFPFTTSDLKMELDPSDKKLKLYYRSFDGFMYRMSQRSPSDSKKWDIGGTSVGFYE